MLVKLIVAVVLAGVTFALEKPAGILAPCR